MAVITFANTKGGAGKTTAVLLLASELARRGLRVCVIDTDPQRWLSKWRNNADHRIDLTVITYVSITTLQQHVLDNRKKFDHVIVDLPGAQSPLLATAVGLSNHVIIPVQGSTMDAQGAAQVLELLRYLDDRAGIKIPHSVLLSRVNSMVTTRALLAAKALLAKRRRQRPQHADHRTCRLPRHVRVPRLSPHDEPVSGQQSRQGTSKQHGLCR